MGGKSNNVVLRSELDEIVDGHDHYQERFTVSLSVFVSDSERKPSQPAPWYTDQTKRNIDAMFTSQIEKDETVDNFGEICVSIVGFCCYLLL